MDAQRFARQIMVVEIGPAGQAAIGARAARVGGDPLAERYALRAGFEGIAPATTPPVTAPEIVGDRDARAVVTAARAVLAEIRAAIEVPR
jgi:hypothetical protein